MTETLDDITLDNSIPKGKIYKDNAIWMGTFLGGPLVAGYLFAGNYKALGLPEKTNSTWIITIIACIVIFGGIIFIPENINIPDIIFPFIYTAVVYVLFKMYQEEEVTQYIDQGGLIYGWGRVVVVGFIGALISGAIILAMAFAYDTVEQANISTKSYGTVVIHEIDYDKNNVSEKEIDGIAEGFKEAGFFDRLVPKYVYVEKNGKTFEISIAVIEGTGQNPEGIAEFKELRDQMDEYFPSNDVKFKLVVDYLENVVAVLK